MQSHSFFVILFFVTVQLPYLCHCSFPSQEEINDLVRRSFPPFDLTYDKNDFFIRSPPKNKRQVAPTTELTQEQKKIKEKMAKGKATEFNDTALPEGEEKVAKEKAQKGAGMSNTASSLTSSSANSPNGTIATKPTSTCDQIEIRRPWSEASREERKNYLKASACLANIPGKWNRDGFKSASIQDDFVLFHAIMTSVLHFNAHLLPCHRLLVNTWFKTMQQSCNYTGDLLYMDFWTYADRGDLWTTSDIWSNSFYGSNRGWVLNGNQKNTRVHYVNTQPGGVKVEQVDRPIKRSLTEGDPKTGNSFEDFMTSDYLKKMLQIDSYDRLRRRLEASTHQYLHRAIGGDLARSTGSVDNFFFAIHTGIDAFWGFYQDMNNGANRFKFDGPRLYGSSEQANLHDSCLMLGLWSQDYNILDLMDIRTKPNCFTYIYNEGTFTDNPDQGVFS